MNSDLSYLITTVTHLELYVNNTIRNIALLLLITGCKCANESYVFSERLKFVCPNFNSNTASYLSDASFTFLGATKNCKIEAKQNLCCQFCKIASSFNFRQCYVFQNFIQKLLDAFPTLSNPLNYFTS